MTKRFAHILRGTRTNYVPANIIWFDTETLFNLGPDKNQYHYLNFGWACYQRRVRGHEWSAPEWFRFDKIDPFWDWLVSKTRDQTRLYFFCHNGGFDLPVMHAFTELPARGFGLSNVVADAPPMILTWRIGKRSIKFIDTLNFWRLPLEKIGESVGIPKLDMPGPNDSTEAWDIYCRRDVEVIRVAVLRWLRFISDNDLGGFAPTLAAQSFRAYRHRFMPVPILIDANTSAQELARQAYVGGRTECFRIGHYEGEFYLVDMNSQYPSVMQKGLYPHKIVGMYGECTHAELVKWTAKYAVVAEVLIDTDVPAFPLVHEGRLIFPVGSFVTTLCSSELDMALDMGVIKGCRVACVYYRAPLFKDYMDFLYAERLKVKAAGDETTTWLYKIMMNSLYGKWGQRGRNYETIGECDADEIDVWTEIDADTLEVSHWRKFGGVVQEWMNEGEALESFPAIAACICADARVELWHAIECAGTDHCYYTDTDSLLVDAEGLARLHDFLNEDELGMWSVEKSVSSIDIYGPKDYRFDDVVKIKGIRKNAVRVSEAVYAQDHFVGFKGLLRRGSLDAPIVHPVTKKLERRYLKGTVSPSGVVSPFRLTAGTTDLGEIALWQPELF